MEDYAISSLVAMVFASSELTIEKSSGRRNVLTCIVIALYIRCLPVSARGVWTQ